MPVRSVRAPRGSQAAEERVPVGELFFLDDQPHQVVGDRLAAREVGEVGVHPEGVRDLGEAVSRAVPGGTAACRRDRSRWRTPRRHPSSRPAGRRTCRPGRTRRSRGRPCAGSAAPGPTSTGALLVPTVKVWCRLRGLPVRLEAAGCCLDELDGRLRVGRGADDEFERLAGRGPDPGSVKTSTSGGGAVPVSSRRSPGAGGANGVPACSRPAMWWLRAVVA